MVHVVQGVYSPTTFQMLQLPKEWYNALEWQYPPHQVSCLLLCTGHCNYKADLTSWCCMVILQLCSGCYQW